MSEWVSVLAVFWALWAVDGVRRAPGRIFTLRSRGRRGVIDYARFSRPGGWPASWRMTASDVPLILSPAGLASGPAGALGRPVEKPSVIQAWRWAEVREVGVARGWIFVNGTRFCPDTGHVTAPQLLALAQGSETAREKSIHVLMRCWLRPAHLRRKARVLRTRTTLATRANELSFVLLMGLTLYIVADFPAFLPERWSEGLAPVLAPLLVGLLTLHVTAIVAAWRAMRRLRPVAPQKRGSALFSALMLPPQAMRLRALAGEGFFPAQHPLALALAFGTPASRAEGAFRTLADLRWPIKGDASPPLAAEVGAWFRDALAQRILPLLGSAGLSADALLAAPAPDAPSSCNYCPRCRDQFVAGPLVCPHGVPLKPVRRS